MEKNSDIDKLARNKKNPNLSYKEQIKDPPRDEDWNKINAVKVQINNVLDVVDSFKVAWVCFAIVAVLTGIVSLVFGILWAVASKQIDHFKDDIGLLEDNLNDLNSWAVTDNLSAPLLVV